MMVIKGSRVNVIGAVIKQSKIEAAVKCTDDEGSQRYS